LCETPDLWYVRSVPCPNVYIALSVLVIVSKGTERNYREDGAHGVDVVKLYTHTYSTLQTTVLHRPTHIYGQTAIWSNDGNENNKLVWPVGSPAAPPPSHFTIQNRNWRHS
jgi:hypothetical protein